MATLIYTCPSTDLKVQHWQDEDQDVPENEYEAVTCLACSRIHFLNRKTGRLLGNQNEL
jgi:hypothetical protein